MPSDDPRGRLKAAIDDVLNRISTGPPGRESAYNGLVPLESFAAELVDRYRFEGRVVEMSDWRIRAGGCKILRFKRRSP